MKKFLLIAASAMMLFNLQAKDNETLYLYAYDKVGEENNLIALSTTDGDMYSATGATFTNKATDLNGIQVTNEDWSYNYVPAGWPEVKIGAVLTFLPREEVKDSNPGGWIWGWTLAESNYIFYQRSTGKFAISANSENPIIGGGGEGEYEELSLYAYDVTHEANVNIPLITKDGVTYTATGYAFPADVPDGFKGIQVHNNDWSKIYAPAAETYPNIVLNEAVKFELAGTGEAWIVDWTPKEEDEFKFNVETGEFIITGTAGVESLITDQSNAIVEYYNMNGMKVANPANGVYIKKQGTQVTKVVLK